MDSLIVTALTVGLLGGLHCVGMCGGVVSAFTLRREAPANAWLTQFAYNSGRIGTYGLLGALAGGLGGAGVAAASLLPAQTMLFVAANGLLILLGLHLAGAGSVVLSLERAGARIWSVARSAGLQRPQGRGYFPSLAAGALWGWTPCGLVYSMLALALVSGSPERGASVMLAFGAGTLPNLLGAAWLLRKFGALLRDRRLRVAAGAVIVLFGLVGIMRVPGLAQQIRAGVLCVTG